jgi:hypothetical protein
MASITTWLKPSTNSLVVGTTARWLSPQSPRSMSISVQPCSTIVSCSPACRTRRRASSMADPVPHTSKRTCEPAIWCTSLATSISAKMPLSASTRPTVKTLNTGASGTDSAMPDRVSLQYSGKNSTIGLAVKLQYVVSAARVHPD